MGIGSRYGRGLRESGNYDLDICFFGMKIKNMQLVLLQQLFLCFNDASVMFSVLHSTTLVPVESIFEP